MAEALKGLVDDEVDAVFGDKVQLWLWSAEAGRQMCEVMGQDIKDTQTLGVGVSAGIRREDIKLRDAFNKALGEMMSDGTYKKLNEKYSPFSAELISRFFRTASVSLARRMSERDARGRA